LAAPIEIKLLMLLPLLLLEKPLLFGLEQAFSRNT
jgi:hypothetical protein